MARIKLCNKCGHRNPANRTSCEECGKDLKGKPMEEAELDRKLAEEAVKQAEAQRQAAEEAAATAAPAAPAAGGEGMLTSFRRCEECGHENPVAAINCEQCGESLDGINIEFREAAQPAQPASAHAPIGQRTILTSLDGLLRYEVKGSAVLGRDNDAGVYLCRKRYVSGIHAKITTGPDGVYIEDLNSRNGTYIGDTRIVSGQRFRVEHDTVICLGGTQSLGQQDAAFLKVEIGV